jgi:hypothetical protein
VTFRELARATDIFSRYVDDDGDVTLDAHRHADRLLVCSQPPTEMPPEYGEELRSLGWYWSAADNAWSHPL